MRAQERKSVESEISFIQVGFFFFKKWSKPRPLFNLFSSFQTHIKIFTIKRCVKKCPSSIQCRDSNSRPLEQASPLITTRPGLPPQLGSFSRFFCTRGLKIVKKTFICRHNKDKFEKAFLGPFCHLFLSFKCKATNNVRIIFLLGSGAGI